MAKEMNRRRFLKRSVKVGAAIAVGGALLQLSGSFEKKISRPLLNLKKDPNGLCDLPEGFSYTVISREGEVMTDGHLVPSYHDGMGCFRGPAGETILVRNHEMPQMFPTDPESPVPELAYDPKVSGGTTTIWLNDQHEVTKHYLSLTGTIMNCSGGVTPWGTWISSEESEPGFWKGGTWKIGKRHGYNFEVDPRAPLRIAQPLKAMGRFKHEAVAVDPNSGIAYQTQDDMNGCFYRFLPKSPGRFQEGGSLQALAFDDKAMIHTTAQSMEIKKPYSVKWVDIDEPDPEENTVHIQAQAKGAAIFVRGEGIAVHPEGIYFACTSGGAMGLGQIFRYTPHHDGVHGTLELIFEVTQRGVLEKPDNLTVNQWGDLIICEDSGLDTQCLVGLTETGKLYYIAANTQAEWAGACFSPDGKVLFANIYKGPGMTLAIQGPWARLRGD